MGESITNKPSTRFTLSQPSHVSMQRHKQTHMTLPFIVDTAFGFLLRTALLAGVIAAAAALREPPGASCFHTAKIEGEYHFICT